MTKIKWVQVQDFDLGAVFSHGEPAPGSPAVRLEYGFRTGSTPGIHSITGHEAQLDLGLLDENLEFEDHDIYEGYDMPVLPNGEIDWDKAIEAVDAFYRVNLALLEKRRKEYELY